MHQRRLAWLVAAVVTLLAFVVPQSAQALTIDFDDITTDNFGWGEVPSNYQGMTWAGSAACPSNPSCWIVLSNDAYTDFPHDNTYTSPSGDNAASNGGGMLTVTVADGANFDFLSASFTGWGRQDQPYDSYTASTIEIQGWNNGFQVATTGALTILPSGYTLISSNIMDIDELRFISSGEDEWWLMDDLTLNAPTVVPEPGTALLMVSGLLGLAHQGRRRRA